MRVLTHKEAGDDEIEGEFPDNGTDVELDEGPVMA